MSERESNDQVRCEEERAETHRPRGEARYRILARYGELVLRGKNLGLYEDRLVENLKAVLRDFDRVSFARMNGRLLMRCDGNVEGVVDRAKHVFGIHSLSPCTQIPAEPEGIERTAVRLAKEALDRRWEPVHSFRVNTKRTDKRFPGTSGEINRRIGGLIHEAHPYLRVDLEQPDLEVGIEIRRNSAFLFTERVPGLLGLPVGTSGKIVCLFSSGIDSPVAAYLAMKRGCEVIFVNFHSYPFVGLKAQETTIAVARRLARYQPTTRLYSVPLVEIQKAVRDRAKETYRIVLYRRAMMRIATEIAKREGALALLTGDCLSQVASQTLENLDCIGRATPLQIHRPMLGYDKTEIMDFARSIGTFELSHRAVEDCCTVFQPKRPMIRGRVEVAEEEERLTATEEHERRALEGCERIELDCLGGEARGLPFSD